jgi:hypothetical protein
MRYVLASLGEFCTKVASRWYAFGVGVIGGLLGLASSLYAQAHPKAAPLIPIWIWLTSLAGGMLVAIIWAFHDVRRERDAAKDELKRSSDVIRYAPRLHRVSLKEKSGAADTVDVQLKLDIENNSGENVLFEIENLSTAIEGKSGDGLSGTPEYVIPPLKATSFGCPPVRGLPRGWQGGGKVELTARYGYTDSAPKYRARWEYELRFSRIAGAPPEDKIDITYILKSEIKVEDIK